MTTRKRDANDYPTTECSDPRAYEALEGTEGSRIPSAHQRPPSSLDCTVSESRLSDRHTRSFDMFLRHRRLDQLALPRRRAREVVVRFPCRALTSRYFFCIAERLGQSRVSWIAIADIRTCELTHHLVNLLQGQTSGLGHEEVGPEDAASA
jgi:hypothetical protein